MINDREGGRERTGRRRGRGEAWEGLLAVDEGRKGGEGQVERGDKRKRGEGCWGENGRMREEGR